MIENRLNDGGEINHEDIFKYDFTNTLSYKLIFAESFINEVFKESRFREPLDLGGFVLTAALSSVVLLFVFSKVKYRRVLSEIPALSFGQS